MEVKPDAGALCQSIIGRAGGDCKVQGEEKALKRSDMLCKAF